MDKKRTAVIGCGVISDTHLSAISEIENAELSAVCDIIPERAEAASKKYSCKCYTDYRKMIESERLDCVHICLPHYLHSEAAVYAMRHGLDVLCEKPVDATLSGAREMESVQKETGRRLGIIFQNRYHTGARFAKNMVESGKMGKLIAVNGVVFWSRDEEYYGGGWRAFYKSAGGGVLINQAIHTLDLMRYFTGSDVKSVSASISHLGVTTAEVEDTAAGFLMFENGVICNFYFTINNICDRPPDIELIFEKGNVVLSGREATARYNNGTIEKPEETPEKACGISHTKACYGSTHIDQIYEFYNDKTGEKTADTLREGMKTAELVDKIFKAAKINV